MAKYKKQKCVHCLKYFEKLTADHILPRSWYPDSTSNDIEKWTVPSCKTCNKKLGKAEEKLFDRLLLCIDEKDFGAMGLNDRLLKKLSIDQKNKRAEGRQIKFLMETVKNFIPYLYEEGNEHVLKGGTPKEGVRSRRMIRIPNEELIAVSEKIIRGLEYKLRNKLIDIDRKLDIITPRENKKELELIKNWERLILPEEKNVHLGPGLVVRYGVNPSDDNWVIYSIKIWNHFEIWGFVSTKNKKHKKQAQSKTSSNELINKAVSLSEKGKTKDAVDIISRSIQKDSSNFYAHFNKARILFENEKYNEALEAINNAIKLNPDNFQSLAVKVSILGLLEKYEESIIVADQALKLKIDEYVLYKKCVSFYHLEKYDDAVNCFSEFLKIRPNDINGIIKQISALALAERYEESVKLFESSDLPESSDGVIYNNLGYSCLKIKRYLDAEKYLFKARRIQEAIEGESLSYVYGNLYLLYSEQKKYIKLVLERFRVLFLPLIKKIKLHRVKRSMGEDYIFKGPGSLFTSDSQYRETLAIWKTFRTPLFWDLCNGTFRWFAINIPLDLIDKKNPQGDIDLLVSMPVGMPSDINGTIKYRAFEIKSILLHKDGSVNSLKRGKHKKVYSQLKKLQNFGCEQIFLLELYIIERGFSDANNFPTKDIVDEVNKKILKFKNDNYGYVMMGHEPTPYGHEEGNGINHIPINAKPTKDNVTKKPFSDLVRYLDSFYFEESKNYTEPGKFTVISYCKHCKQLIMLHADDTTFICPKCSKTII